MCIAAVEEGHLKPEHDFTAVGYFGSKKTFIRKCGSVYLHLLSKIRPLKKRCAVWREQSYGTVQGNVFDVP